MWEILEVLRRVARGERPRALGLDMRSEIGEGHPRPGRVHMAISIPEKYAAVQVGGYIKAKRAIHIARESGEGRRNLVRITSGHGATSSRRQLATGRRFGGTSSVMGRRIAGRISRDSTDRPASSATGLERPRGGPVQPP